MAAWSMTWLLEIGVVLGTSNPRNEFLGYPRHRYRLQTQQALTKLAAYTQPKVLNTTVVA